MRSPGGREGSGRKNATGGIVGKYTRDGATGGEGGTAAGWAAGAIRTGTAVEFTAGRTVHVVSEDRRRLKALTAAKLAASVALAADARADSAGS